MAQAETMLASFLHATVLNLRRLEDSLSYLLAEKLATAYISAMATREVIDQAFALSPRIGEAARLLLPEPDIHDLRYGYSSGGKNRPGHHD